MKAMIQIPYVCDEALLVGKQTHLKLTTLGCLDPPRPGARPVLERRTAMPQERLPRRGLGVQMGLHRGRGRVRVASLRLPLQRCPPGAVERLAHLHLPRRLEGQEEEAELEGDLGRDSMHI